MPTEVFHMDANGVWVSADRAVFAEHTYATRNITGIAQVQDRGVRWPGMVTFFAGIGLLAGGLAAGHAITLLIGAAAVLSGSLNLARKRAKFGIRLTTQRGPVYVLASRDKHYVETVSTALRRAVSAAQRTPRSREPTEDEAPAPPAADSPAHTAGPVRRRAPSGRPTPPRRRRRR